MVIKMEFQGKKVLVIGTGVSGIAAAKLLDGISEVILYDANGGLNAMDIRKKLPEQFRGRIALGRLTDELIHGADYAVLSPGVPVDLPDVERLRKAGARIIGEIELAYQFGKGRIAAKIGRAHV